MHLIGMASLGERIMFVTGEGVAELIDRTVTIIKSGFKTASISSGRGRVFVIEPAQEQPRFVEYDPSVTDALWCRITI